MSLNESIRYGIDLGTTNSSIAILHGEDVLVVPSKHDMQITPSVVALSHRAGRVEAVVGHGAKQRLASDRSSASSVVLQFKEYMGNPAWSFGLPGTEHKETAPQLSARVLGELVGSLKRVAGLPELRGAVITVPAVFPQPALDDTMKAGEAAGIPYVELFPEPAAAALAFGRRADTSRNPVWLTYDLGGGTFDVALVRGEEGVFTIIDCDGDRHLGGSDLDAAIAKALILPQLPSALRNQAETSALWGRLKDYAESAKIELDVAPQFVVPLDVEGLEQDIRIDRAAVDELEAKLFKRTLKICRTLLDRNGFTARQIDRVILVGGPTRSPFLRSMIEHGLKSAAGNIEGLGIPLDHSVNPMTAVAQGAALRAAARRLPAGSGRAGAAASAQTQVAVDLFVPAQVLPDDTDVIVAGTVRALRPGVTVSEQWAVVLERIDGKGVGWHSEPIALSNIGKFTRTVKLQAGRNEFRVRVLDAKRSPVEADSGAGFEVLRGIVMGEMTMPRGLGIADAQGKAVWFFGKGDGLPSGDKTLPFRTTVALQRGHSDVIVIPVVEGVDQTAGLNGEVFTLRIPYEAGSRDIPAGSLIRITLSIDESRTISMKAELPDFKVLVQPEKFDFAINANAVRDKLKRTRSNLDLFRQVRKLSRPIDQVVAQIDESETIAEIEALLAEGSAEHTVPWDKAMTLELETMRLMDPHLGEVNELLAWEPLKASCDRNVVKAKEIVRETAGLPSDWVKAFDELCRRYDEAVAKKDRIQTYNIAFDRIPEHFQKEDKLKVRVGGGPDPIETSKQVVRGDDGKGTIELA